MRDIRNVLYINSAGNNPVHEESAVAAGATRDTRSGVRKMSGVRASTALLVGGALCALLLLLGGCSESNGNGNITCDTDVATADCDNDGVLNSTDVDDDNDGLIEINFPGRFGLCAPQSGWHQPPGGHKRFPLNFRRADQRDRQLATQR